MLSIRCTIELPGKTASKPLALAMGVETPGMARYLAVSDRMILMWEGTAYEIQ